MDRTKKSMLSGPLALALLGCCNPLLASGVNSGMPNRISMNVTVPKQTQGATFGEKVNAGLHAAGVAQGASAIVVDCGRDACALVFPDGSGYRADTTRMTVQPLTKGQAEAVRKDGARTARDASLLGAALPGGAIISAAVSSVGALAGGHGAGAAAASYAATGRMSDGGKEGLATATMSPGVIDILDPLADGDYLVTVVVAKAPARIKDTLKTQVRAAVTQQVRIEVGFSVDAGMLKTKHDTAKNSVGNVR